MNDLSHLLFPHNCHGCGTDVLSTEQLLCAGCLHQLPATMFIGKPGNPVEKIFYGRIPVASAAAAYYFTKESLLQHLLIQLKYRNNKSIGHYLGNLAGLQLQQAASVDDIDVIIPLPLNPRKEARRGYNQAAVIAHGIAQVINKPVVTNAIERTTFTETQTHQDRIHRWQNMEGVFAVSDTAALQGKHVLLVDDVVTTGATLEACGAEIIKINGTKLNILTVAYTI